MKVVSFFSGCGGLDLGFEQAGFEVVWANDNDPAVSETYLLNHPNTYLCQKDMRELAMDEIPECDGFIGGPPCQSWSEGGKQLGLDDERGKMFLTYISIIRAKQPKFFVIENVKGILGDKQLRMTLENKLYYVRAGLRAGAMQFSLGMKAPHYLFLHKKDSYILLILKEVEPKLVSAEYLENLGFHPSGDQYWTFEILDVEAGERTECMKNYVAKHGGMKMKPYIIEITNVVAKS